MPRIQQLGADVVALVRGGVGISSFAGAVAQLVANAIDASLHGARCTVRVDLDVVRGCIRVEDDAAGMSQEDMRLVGQRYCTSKPSMPTSQHGAPSAPSLGYKGEALASLATMCLQLRIASRVKGSFETYVKVFQGRDVKLAPGGPEEMLEKSGTVVTVQGFKHNQPVRLKHDVERHQQALEQAVWAAFLVALPFPHVSLIVQEAHGRRLLELTQGRSITSSLPMLFPGASVLSSRTAWPEPEGAAALNCSSTASADTWSLQTFLCSQPMLSRDRQFVFVNGRLVSVPAVSEFMAAWFSKHRRVGQARDSSDLDGHSKGQHPGYLLLLSCPPAEVELVTELDSSLVATFKSRAALQGLLQAAVTTLQQPAASNPAPTAPAARCQTAAASRAVVSQQDWPQWAMWPQAPPGNEATMELPNRGSGGSGSSGRAARLPLPPALAVRPGTSRQPTAEQSQVSRSIIGNFLDGIARRSGSGGACRSGSGAAADAAAAGVTQRKVGSAATLQQPAELVGRLAKLQPSAQQPARWEQQQVQEQQQLVDTEADCGGSWRMQHQQEVSLTFSPGPDQRSKQGTDRQWLRSDAGDGRRVQNAGHTASRLCTAACTADLLLLERSEPIQARHDQLELLEAPQVRSTAWPVHGMSPPQQLADSPLEQYQSHKRGSCARVTASGFDLLSKSPVRGDLLPTTRRWQSNPGSDMVWDASSDLSPVAGSSAEMGLTGSYVCRQGRLTSLQQLPLDDVSPFAGNLSHLHATANQDQLFSLTSPCPMLQAPQGACGSRASSDSPAAPQFGADLELLPEPLPKQHGQGSGNTFQLLCGPGLPLIHEAVRRRGQALELGIAASPSLHDVCELSVSTDLPTSPSLECSVLRGMGRGCFADGMTSPAVVPVPAPAPTPLVTVSPLPSHAACGPEPSGRACRAQPAASPWATWSPRYDLGNTSPSPAAPLVPGSSPRQGCKVAGIANDRPAVQRCTPAPTGWRRRGDPELLLDAAEADTDADAEDGEACSDLSVSPGLVASVLFEEALQVAAPASKPSAQVAEAVRLAGQVQSQCESQHSEQSSAAPAAPPLPQPASPEGGQAVGLEAAGNVEEAMVDTPHSHLPVAAAAVEEIEAGQEPEQLSVCRRLQFGDQEQTTMQADEEGSTAIQYEQPAMAAEAAQQYASSPTATTPAGMEAAGGPADIMDASNVAELQAPTPLPAVLCAQAAQAVGEVQAGAAKCKPPRKRVQFTSPVAATAIKRPARTGLAGPAVCAAVAAPASTQQPTLAAALDAQSLASAAAAAAVMAPSRGCALGEGGENGDMNTLPAAVEGVAVAAEDMMDEDARSGDTELGNGSPGPDQAEEGSDNMLYSGEPEDYVDAASSFGAQLQSACNDVSPAWGSSAAKLAAAADSDSPVFSSPDGSIEDGSCGSAGSPDCQPACIGPEAERMAELFNEDETGGGAVNPVSMPSSEEGDGGLEAAGEQAGETALPTDLSPSEQHDDLASEQEGSAQGMDADAKQATIQPEAAMDDADAACEAACSPIELPSSAAACTQPMPTAATAPDTAEGMNTGEVHQRGKVQARLRQLLPRPAAQPHAANPLGGAGNLARTLLMGKRKAASHMPAPAGPPGPGAQDQTVQGQSALQRLLAGAWENPVKVQRQRLQATSVLSLEDLEGPAKGSTLSLRRAASKLVPADVTKPMLDSARVIGQVGTKFIALTCGDAFVIADQHAADERVRLEMLTAAVLAARCIQPSSSEPGVPPDWRDPAALRGFRLNQPQVLNFSRPEAAAWHTHKSAACAWGWQLQDSASAEAELFAAADGATTTGAGFGAHVAFIMTHVPEVLGCTLNATDLKLYLHQMSESATGDSIPDAVQRLLKSKACRSAIMFGDELSYDSCENLIRDLQGTKLWSSCAHGRPTMAPILQLSALEQLVQDQAGTDDVRRMEAPMFTQQLQHLLAGLAFMP